MSRESRIIRGESPTLVLVSAGRTPPASVRSRGRREGPGPGLSTRGSRIRHRDPKRQARVLLRASGRPFPTPQVPRTHLRGRGHCGHPYPGQLWRPRERETQEFPLAAPALGRPWDPRAPESAREEADRASPGVGCVPGQPGVLMAVAKAPGRPSLSSLVSLQQLVAPQRGLELLPVGGSLTEVSGIARARGTCSRSWGLVHMQSLSCTSGHSQTLPHAELSVMLKPWVPEDRTPSTEGIEPSGDRGAGTPGPSSHCRYSRGLLESHLTSSSPNFSLVE